ncbi:MAG: hypothetical protein IT456_14055 [Planctomycetes bacterium]|nr:hypothetical protein [Planctomycetota bacterium]
MTLTAGVITVEASVTPTQGATFTLPPLTIYNHKNGANPPSTKVIWCSPTGLDTNAGTQAAPVLSIQKACELACTNSDAGGATVYLTAGAHLWARGGNNRPAITTSGDYWLTIAPDPGASAGSVIVTRQEDSSSWLRINNTSSNPNTFRLRVRKLVIEGKGIVVANQPSMTTHIWLDGCEERGTFTSSNHLGAFDTDAPGAGAQYTHYLYVTGGYRHHVVNGWHGWALVRGCRLENFLAIATQCTGDNQGVCNVCIKTQRYKSGVAGWFEPIDDLFDFSVPAAGVLRVTAGNTSVPAFTSAAAQLINQVTWGIKITAATGASTDDNSGTFMVLSTGATGGLPYVDLAFDGGVAGSPTDSIQIRVARISDGAIYEEVNHPDILHVNTNPVNYMFSNVRVHDIGGSQGIFAKNRNLARCAFVNVTLGLPTDSNSKFETDNNTGGLEHVLLRHVTAAGIWLFEVASNFSYNHFEVHDCGFQKAALLSSGSFSVSASHNHFEVASGGGGITFGANATVPSPSFWSDTNHLTSGNYSASSSLASASNLWSRPTAYVPATPPRGAWSNTNRETSDGGW